MSETRKVTVTATRYYSKQTTVEVDVPLYIQDNELVDFLTESEELTNQIEEGLSQDSLEADDESYEFQDPTNDFGGHL
jgi:methylaspartate ammonia-lyase